MRNKVKLRVWDKYRFYFPDTMVYVLINDYFLTGDKDALLEHIGDSLFKIEITITKVGLRYVYANGKWDGFTMENRKFHKRFIKHSIIYRSTRQDAIDDLVQIAKKRRRQNGKK